MDFLAGPSKRTESTGAGPLTYRHVLSPQAMTVNNPLRVIAHCDIDAAYAQFEQVRLGLPDDVPLICAQWQSIIAVNYPARKYGIKRFNTIDEARKMCPHLHVQHVATYRNGEAEAGYWGEVDPRTHKVSLDPYRRESLKILAIFKEVVPRGEIEKASIDEAFLDLSMMVMERILERFPHLRSVPADAPDGLDTPLPPPPHIDWSKAGNVFPIKGDKPEKKEVEASVERKGEQEGDTTEQQGEEGLDTEVTASSPIQANDGDEDTPSWEDWALCIGAELMAELRAEIYDRLHYTCSAGIAHGKAMAKLCSAWKKPNNQTVLRMSATPAFLRDMDFTDIRFLGGKLGNAIATEFGAKTVGDMLTVPLEEMQRRFGEESIWVYNIIRGIDHTEVTARTATKSMLASKNVRPNVTTPEQGYHWINVLAGELFVRLRDAREISPGIWPKSLVLSHRTGIDPSRSRQTPFPFTRNLSAEYIVKFARKLWVEVTQPMNKGNMKLNNIALAFSGLERLEEGQKGIEGFFNPSTSTTKSRSASPYPETSTTVGITSSSATASKPATNGSAANDKRSRPTSPRRRASPIQPSEPSPKKPRLPTLHTGKRKTGLESFLSASNEKPGQSSTALANIIEPPKLAKDTAIDLTGDSDTRVLADDSLDPQANREGVEEGSHWTCPECGVSLEADSELEEDDKAKNLREKKQEHQDYHFALSLQSGPSPARPAKPKIKDKAKGGGDSGGRVKKKSEGIKAFFAPKTK